MMDKRDWELWDRPGVVPRIEEVWKHPLEVSHREILAKLSSDHVMKGDKFLEVGCGSGLMCKALAQHVTVSYTGVDTSKEMIRVARAAFPGMIFQEGDGYKLPFPDQSFDVVAAYDVLQHLPDIVGFIREMVRVSCRTVIFTMAMSAKTIHTNEDVLGNKFLHNRYSEAEAKTKVMEGSGGIPYKTFTVDDVSRLWVLTKGPIK
jgi:ubiquinone/menaquinone biosynthesis C-methylase UbiE